MSDTPVSTPVPVSRSSQTRVLLGAVIGLIGGFSVVYFTTLSLFIVPITEEFGWGRAELSAVAVLAMLGSALAAPLAGRLAERYGSRPIVAGSAVLLCSGLLVLAVAPASQAFVAAVALFIGVFSVGTTAAGHLVNLPRFFEKRLGLAFGVAMAGSGVGAAIMQFATNSVIGASGWRSAYVMLAVVAFTCSTVSVAIGFPRGTGPFATSDPRQTGGTLPGMTAREALRSPQVWTIFGCVFLVAAAVLGFSVHVVAFVTDRGFSTTTAASVAAVGALGVTAGRLLSGALLDRFHAARVGGLTFALAAAGFIIQALPSTMSPLVFSVAALIAALALGAEGDLIPFLVRRYVGLRAYPTMLGAVLGAFSLGGAFGPVLYGLSFDLLGGYEPALWSGAVALLVAAAGLQTLGAYRYPDARSAAVGDPADVIGAGR